MTTSNGRQSTQDVFGPLISGQWVAEHIDAPDVRVIDLRWYLDHRSGHAAYLAGHIPGAVFVDLDGPITGRTGEGLHPLPQLQNFERAMRDAGVNHHDRVVVYDDDGGFPAARLWWLLRYFGHRTVAVLDGGLSQWPGALSTAESRHQGGDFIAKPPTTDRAIGYEDVRRLPPSVLLLDARRPSRFRGEFEPREPRAGHIPGARNAHWRDNLGADQRFLSPEQLRHRFTSLGVRDGFEVVAYCGSGITACHNLLALELAGLPGGKLYPGSWSDWSYRPDAPAATGDA